MSEPDIDPLVRTLVEDRAHAINNLIMDAPLTGATFPGEKVQNVINLSLSDNTIGYLCYFMAILVDTHFRQAVEMKRGG